MPPPILAEQSAGQSIVIVLGLIFLYFIPSIIARDRKVPSVGSVFVINLFLGWTFIGWVVALAMAARTAPDQGALKSGETP